MKLYHGSIYDFTQIDVRFGNKFKDFGPGFYTTGRRDHAERIAIRNMNILNNRAENQRFSIDRAYIYRFEFNSNNIDGLKILKFDTADIMWVKFIILNRKSATKVHPYDIVIGPTADTYTMTVLNRYMGSINKNTPDSIYLQIIRELKPTKLPKQYYFGTNKAVSQVLKFDDTWRDIIYNKRRR